MTNISRKSKAVVMYCALAAYIIQVNHNFVKRAAVIERERMLSTDLGNGQCELLPTHKIAAAEGAQRSLLVSFPGESIIERSLLVMHNIISIVWMLPYVCILLCLIQIRTDTESY